MPSLRCAVPIKLVATDAGFLPPGPDVDLADMAALFAWTPEQNGLAVQLLRVLVIRWFC